MKPQHIILIILLVVLIVVITILATAGVTIVLVNKAHEAVPPVVVHVSSCNRSDTTASGSYAKPGPYCSGDLIFEDNFDRLDSRRWENENSLAGGGNWEFQWYTTDRENSFVKDGILHIKPTLTSDYLGLDGDKRLATDTIAIPANECTLPKDDGCERTGSSDHYLNPIRSARLHSIHSFSFKYGRVEIRAKLPSGDWLWPALWMMPKDSVYGQWPRSGAINIMDARGNYELYGEFIGSQKSGSVLCYGPYPQINGCWSSGFTHRYVGGFKDKFRRYQLEWSPTHVKFAIDDELVGFIEVGDGFWERGQFAGKGAKNPWEKGTLMAPFDQEFYIIMNLAVGGVSGYFPDNANKPWRDDSETASKDFWDARASWYPTWKPYSGSTTSSYLIDYVRVWAI